MIPLITLDGHTNVELNLIVLRGSQYPVLPSTVDRTLAIPGRDGAYYFGTDLSVRSFEIRCAINAQSSQQLREQAATLASFLMDDYGKPREIELVILTQPDRRYMVRYSGSLPIDRLVSYGEFVLPLTAFDPFAYAIVSNNDITWGSEIITFNSNYLMGHEGGETQTITANTSLNVAMSGSIAVRPTITIVGTGIGVTFSANGKSFTIENLSGSKWVIDGQRYRVTKDGANGLSTFVGDFLELLNGDNNVVITGSSMNFSVQITFRDKYL